MALALGLASACNAITPSLLGSGSGVGSDAAIDAVQDMPEPGLILRYAFEDTDSTVRDISGRHKDGMALVAVSASAADMPTTAVWTADGRIGRALALTGTQHVALPAGVLEDVNDFTIATWVKVNTNDDWARVYDFGNDAGTNFMYLTISGFVPNAVPPVNDGVHVSSYGGAPTNENLFATSTHLPTSVWKHVAVTGTGGNRTLYIDGFPAGGDTAGPDVPPQLMEPMSQHSWLGKSHFTPPDAGLNGTLDDFRIYNRVLAANEIQDLAAPQHDYSYWRFDETSGTSAMDSSANAITATLTPDLTRIAGRLGNAVKLPGGAPGTTGPHIELAASPLASCSDFTVAVWIKPDAIDSSHIFDFGTGASSFIYLSVADASTGGLHFGMSAPGNVAFNLATPATQVLKADGLWHHVAVTLLSGTATIYLDGVAAPTMGGTTITPKTLGTTTENWIGRSRAGDKYLSGSLDELRIACRAYTADEITNLSRP